MRQTRRGHNLLEVIIAVFIFLTVLVLLMSVWGLYHKALTKSKDRLVASNLAVSLIERHIAMGYKNLNADVGKDKTYPPVTFMSVVRGRIQKLTLHADFDCEDMSHYPRLRHLIVHVRWEEKGAPQKLTYDTYLFDRQ